MRAPRCLVSGGTGIVGRFIVERLLDEGYAVTVAGRSAPADGLFPLPVRFQPLDLAGWVDPASFDGCNYLIHAAFDHLPGRYRGGEGDDPDGFWRRNVDGSTALFLAAKAAGVKRAVYLSSRAVYGDQPPGAELIETTAPRPDTLYGRVKLACEEKLAERADETFRTVSLRVTGVYGPAGAANKWNGLIEDYLAGRPVASRVGTEVHGEDVAWAVMIALTAPIKATADVFNVSDIVVDNADVLALVQSVTGSPHPLPEQANRAALNVMATAKLRALGWRPGGRAVLEDTVRAMAKDHVSD